MARNVYECSKVGLGHKPFDVATTFGGVVLI